MDDDDEEDEDEDSGLADFTGFALGAEGDLMGGGGGVDFEGEACDDEKLPSRSTNVMTHE